MRDVGVHARNWDNWSVHFELGRLIWQRWRFRIDRLRKRILDPRRVVATCLAVLFFALFLANGIFILSARQPADPERLRLWLSGGMVLYAVYHAVRCFWTRGVADLEMTAAEKLWLGGGPIRPSSLAIYHLANIVAATVLKTCMLAVVLVRDVPRIEFLLVGMFCSLLVLELVRLIIQQLVIGLDDRLQRILKIGMALIAASIVLQILTRIAGSTQLGSPTLAYLLNFFQSLGQVAACDTIQWMSLLWVVPAKLAVSEGYDWHTIADLLAAIGSVPLCVLIFVRVSAWSCSRQHQREAQRLEQFESGDPAKSGDRKRHVRANRSLRDFGWLGKADAIQDAMVVVSRHAVSVSRYRGTILMSFVLPTILCLSPLLTGQSIQQWLFVVGGIAMCTIALAPPALKIDFRRDLKRMLFLRGLPVSSRSMVLGQLALPIAITLLFQWSTLAIAALVVGPAVSQILLWWGVLAALAVGTFAGENALFLAYPHHQHTEGVTMMIRAKLTFLAKGTVIAVGLGSLTLWAIACTWLPQSLAPVGLVTGGWIGSGMLALIAWMICVRCWHRFDVSRDVPPQ